MDQNFVAMTGNLCGDPRVTHLAEDRMLVSFLLASNRFWVAKNGEKKSEACFIEVSCFGKIAEKMREFATKGTRVWVEGSLRQQRWDDKQTGAKRSKHAISASNVLIMSGRGTGKKLSGERRERKQGTPTSSVAQGPEPPPGDEFGEDDIPQH